MAEPNPMLLALIRYQCREGFFHAALRLAEENLHNFVNDPTLTFYAGVAHLMEGQSQKALRMLEPISGMSGGLALGALHAMIHAHKTASSVDREAVALLESRARDERRSGGESAAYNAALFYSLSDQWDRAREFLDKTSGVSAQYTSLRGWVDLKTGRDMKGALKAFDEAIASGEKVVDAWLGKAHYHHLRQNSQAMLEAIDNASTLSANFLATNVERMKAQLLGRNWEKMMEQVERCLVIDPDSLHAQIHAVLYTLGAEGKYSDAANQIASLITELERLEPRNHRLFVHLAQLFSRISGGKLSIVQQTKVMVDKALAMNRSSAGLTELGRELRMQGQWKLAIRAYKEAMEIETSSPDPMIGLGYCQLMEGNLSDAEAQVEFIKAAHNTTNPVIPELELMEAMIGMRKREGASALLPRFRALVSARLSSTQGKPFGPEYLIALDPAFVLDVVGHMLGLVPESGGGSATEAVLAEVQRVVAVVTEGVPGLASALFLAAKAKFLAKQLDPAVQLLKQSLAKDDTNTAAHLLLAQIYMEKKNLSEASKCLEVGLSLNFAVRDHPLYHLLKARISKKAGNIDGSVKQLQSLMDLPSFKQKGGGKKSAETAELALTEGDRVSVFLELIDSLQILEKTAEANALMESALREFRGTLEEERLLLCSADLAVARGDVEKALTMLKTVKPDQPNYLPAMQKMAEIYLHHKKDKRQFALCYKELVGKNPTPEAFVLLGDAYMSIQEPERAIEVYEQAMKKNPKDHELARKIGKAYVRAHLYNKAVNYYEAALKSGQQNFLRQDLGELLFKLKNFDKCERILRAGLDAANKAPHDASSLAEEVGFLELLSKVEMEKGDVETGLQSLTSAKDLQTQLLTSTSSTLHDLPAQQAKAASLCCQLAEFHEKKRELDKAIRAYNDALKIDDSDPKINLALGQLYLMTGNLDESNKLCQNVLRSHPGNDQATLMMADLMYQRNQTESAMFHFQHLLDRNPNQYHALSRLVELSWRSGDGEQAERYLKAALDKSPRATLDPGYNYCKGLYEWYTGETNAGLQGFNRARRDVEWGERAVYNMITICLNPDNEIIGGEVLESAEAGEATGSDRQDAREMGVRTAERFLKELRFKPGLDFNYRLMENFILLATKNRGNIDQALENFAEMAGGENSEEVENVGAVLGLARAYMILKQTPKAKAQLKRVLGFNWTIQDASFLEQCWLLLADLYIAQAKYDVAASVLDTTLKHNQSCVKAYEYMGYIREKEAKWAAASDNYEQAWKLSKKRNPTIGYKLGYNLLKSKRLVEAIDTCHRVLSLFPNYPRIRRDILDKARANLRM